jgi:hypothetical protein
MFLMWNMLTYFNRRFFIFIYDFISFPTPVQTIFTALEVVVEIQITTVYSKKGRDDYGNFRNWGNVRPG